MKKIIVPTDFSSISLNAVNYATDMAVDIDAELLLVHIYQFPVSLTEVPIVMVSVDEIKRESEDKLLELKKNIEHTALGKLKIRTHARLGDTVDELQSICEQEIPFAVVIGAKGVSAVERVFWGSTALKAIRHLTSPVLVIPPGKEYGNGIRKIGFASDSPFIKQFVSEFDAELYELPEDDAAINQFADDNNLDLVITIPKKQKLLEGIFKQSSTKRLVFHSHVPVLCIHEETKIPRSSASLEMQ
jgi:nucleotide-binding universal stress UspA family protein